MLARMYLYFFERRDWDVSELDRQYGEQAGIKSVTFRVGGEYAYGYLKAEAGVHRLVRPSPFNAQNKRQTSFASVDVVPEFPEDDKETEIPEADLDIVAFVRAAGPGGQNVNKVATSAQLRFDTRKLTLPEDAAIRLNRIAGQRMTKDGVIVIQAQRFRTQERNRQDAIDRLVEMLREAMVRPIPRRPTKPTFGSKQRRLEGKKRRSDIKAGRGGRGFDD